MPTYEWTGTGLASGTVLDNTNINAAGNGTGSLIFQALSGGATRTTIQEANGSGVEITGPAGSLARLDTSAIAGGAVCMAVSFRYRAPATPTTDHEYLIVGRNANATPASTSHVVHTMTTNLIEFRNAANTVVAGGQSPALTSGQYYDVDMAVLVNTTATPTTSNGRIIGRVVALNNANWVSTGVNEFFVDTGYTVNVTVDNTNLFRTGKAATAGAVGTFRFLNLRWRDLATPSTSTTKSNAITNFAVAVSNPPTISTTGTGAYYLLYGVGTAGAGGALSYSIVQNAGNPQTPVNLAPGIYRVTQDPNGSLTYTITVTEAGNGDTSTTHVVPAGSAGGVSGTFRRQMLIGGVLV